MSDAELGIFPYLIRETKPKKDIRQIPDLIEVCFSDYLDEDGFAYLNRLRKAAEKLDKRSFFRSTLLSPTDLKGVVCENPENKLIGNISLFPTMINGKPGFLIANVCVLPNFRRLKIATKMLSAALALAKRSGASVVSLQSRMDNPCITNLYQSLGFSIDAERTSWIYRPGLRKIEIANPAHFSKPSWHQRKDFSTLFQSAYPKNLRWNMSYDPCLFIPGRTGQFTRFMGNEHNYFLRAEDRDGVIGWIAYQEMTTFNNVLWVIPAQDSAEERISTLLKSALRQTDSQKPLTVNFRSGLYAQAFEAAGFNVQSRLIWMSQSLN